MCLKRMIVVALLLAAPLAWGNELDELVVGLAGENEVARVAARQLLPRYGVEALDPLLPLLSHEKSEVNRAAYNVIEDIANEACAPGRWKDRLEAAALFMTLVAPEQPREIKLKGLRLLAVVVPEGFSVEPVAALLKDEDLREDARAALMHIGTEPASEGACGCAGGCGTLFRAGALGRSGKHKGPGERRCGVAGRAGCQRPCRACGGVARGGVDGGPGAG